MYAAIYWLLTAYLAIYLPILFVCHKYTSALWKIISAVLLIAAITLIATNQEIPIEGSRFWPSVLLFIGSLLTNLFVMAAKKDQIK